MGVSPVCVVLPDLQHPQFQRPVTAPTSQTQPDPEPAPPHRQFRIRQHRRLTPGAQIRTLTVPSQKLLFASNSITAAPSASHTPSPSLTQNTQRSTSLLGLPTQAIHLLIPGAPPRGAPPRLRFTFKDANPRKDGRLQCKDLEIGDEEQFRLVEDTIEQLFSRTWRYFPGAKEWVVLVTALPDSHGLGRADEKS